MANFPWYKKRERTCAFIVHIGKLTEADNHEAAIAAALELERACEFDGIDSATVYWSLAVVHDNAGRLPQALDYILKAVRKDALSHSVDRSLSIILDKVRSHLIENRSWAESEVAMYSRLAEEGLADDEVRLRFGDYLMDMKRYPEALRVGQGIAMFSPRNFEAWDLIEAAATEMKDFIVATDAKCSAMAARAAKEEPKANMASARA